MLGKAYKQGTMCYFETRHEQARDGLLTQRRTNPMGWLMGIGKFGALSWACCVYVEKDQLLM